MERPITKVYVLFSAIAKGKRKLQSHKLELAELIGHAPLTPELFNYYERIAWAKIAELPYREVSSSAHLMACQGRYAPESDIIMVNMFPKQQQLILK